MEQRDRYIGPWAIFFAENFINHLSIYGFCYFVVENDFLCYNSVESFKMNQYSKLTNSLYLLNSLVFT